MRIIGVSFDPPEKNAEWREKKGFTFELWSDVGRELAQVYGAADSADAKFAQRITVVLDPQGQLALVYPQVGVGTHPADVLDDVKKRFPQK